MFFVETYGFSNWKRHCWKAGTACLHVKRTGSNNKLIACCQMLSNTLRLKNEKSNRGIPNVTFPIWKSIVLKQNDNFPYGKSQI